jgi:DUF3072 family protein
MPTPAAADETSAGIKLELIRCSAVMEPIALSGRLFLRNKQGTTVMSKQKPAENSNRLKDPDEWVTGDEEMTGAQESYLHTLAQEAHEKVDDELTKAEASKEIDRLKEKTGRGQAAQPSGRKRKSH